MPRILTPPASSMNLDCSADAASATLWLVRSTAFDAAQQAALRSMLSAGETPRHAEFVRPQRQLQFLIGRNLLRYAIAATASVPLRSISVMERPGHAPHAGIPAEHGPTPYFSLSHSGQFIACLVSKYVPVGVDIEHPRSPLQPQRDVLALSNAAFSAEEHAWLLRQHEDLRQAAFYRLWNTKEALYKLMSEQRKPVDAFPSLVDADGIFCDSAADWHSAFFMHDDLFVATCSSKPLLQLVLIDDIIPGDFLHN